MSLHIENSSSFSVLVFAYSTRHHRSRLVDTKLTRPLRLWPRRAGAFEPTSHLRMVVSFFLEAIHCGLQTAQQLSSIDYAKFGNLQHWS
jgi:hypothetical protein